MNNFANYGTISYFGVPVFTTGIYSAWFSFSDPTAARELATMLIGFVALALLAERMLRGRAVGRAAASLSAANRPVLADGTRDSDAEAVQFRHAGHRRQELRLRRKTVLGGGAFACHRGGGYHSMYPLDPQHCVLRAWLR